MRIEPRPVEHQTIRVRLTLLETALGTVPKSKDVYAKYIATKAPKPEEAAAEEVETVQEAEEKGWTGFHCDDKGLFLFDYVVRGFLKAAAQAMRPQLEVSAYKTKIDTVLFPEPRRIHFLRDGQPIAKPDGVVERPLRAQTAQGPRVTLARSDSVNPGAVVEFTIRLLKNKDITPQVLADWFNYGQHSGLGQFRSGGYGRFTAEVELVADSQNLPAKKKEKVPAAA